VTRIGPCLFAHTVLEAIEPHSSGRTALLSHFRRTIHGNSGPQSQNVSHTPATSRRHLAGLRKTPMPWLRSRRSSSRPREGVMNL
jgi:hypothetical protein